LANRKDIDWQQVDVINKTWDHKKEGLTQEAAIIVAIVVTIFTAGAASSAGVAAAEGAGFATATTAASTTVMATAGGTAFAAATAAAVTTLATQATIALINSQGDIGAALQEMASEQNLKVLATSVITAGLVQGLGSAFNLPTGTGTSTTLIDKLQTNMVNGVASSLVSTAINGGSLEDNLKAALKNAVITSVAAQGAGMIGDANLDIFSSTLAHAILGCAIGTATTGQATGSGGGCAAGAGGAVVGELAANWYGANVAGATTEDIANFAKLATVLVAAGGGAAAMNLAGMTSNNAVQNNFLNHYESSRRKQLQEQQLGCKTNECREGLQVEIDRLNKLDAWRDAQIAQACTLPSSDACKGWNAALSIAADSYKGQWGNSVDTTERSQVVNMAYLYQARVNSPFAYGVGIGLLKLAATPIMLVAGAGSAINHILQVGGEQALIDAANAIVSLPSDLKARLNSTDPTIQGEALIDLIALGTGGAALVKGGVTTTLNAVEKNALAKVVAEADAKALAKMKVENNLGRDADSFVLATEQMVQARNAGWTLQNGRPWYPPNNGAVPGTEFQTTLSVGTRLDRYGDIRTDTDFLAAANTPLGQRALPAGSENLPRIQLEVVKPLPVQQSNIMPWFDQPGMGVQYQTTMGTTGMTVQQLINMGYLKVVK
jgi:hypothetical protein